MGSRGTGRFGDYSPTSDETLCRKVLPNVVLDDVALSGYFLSHSEVPPEGLGVRLKRSLVNGRLVVESGDGVHVIGNLPTELNYLLLCLEAGYSDEGEVTYSRQAPIPMVEVSLDAK